MAYLAEIPKYAFGTAFNIGQGPDAISEGQFEDSIRHAIDLGVKHFDCAPLYKTQHLVGQIIKSYENATREELFLTSKLPVNMMGNEELIEKSLEQTLKELQTSYLDLFLIHAPFATKYLNDDDIYPLAEDGNLLLDQRDGLLESAWRQLADIKRRGIAKLIGISNINIEQLERLNKIHQIDVVQNEFHLYNQDKQLFDLCEEIDVHYEAYAAFGSPKRAKSLNKPSFMYDPIVERVSVANNISKAQVIIKWLHHQPLSYVIRTDTKSELEENIEATRGATLPMNDLIDLDSSNKNIRLYRYDIFKGIVKHKEYPFKNEHSSNITIGIRNL